MIRLNICVAIVVSCLLVSVSFAHQDASQNPGKSSSDNGEFHCDDPQTQIDMNVCAGISYRKLDAKMKDLYTEQMAYLNGDAKDELRSAQAAWVEYRDKSCLYEAGKDPQSYMESINIACLSRITQSRIVTLNEYLACRENGCPYD